MRGKRRASVFEGVTRPRRLESILSALDSNSEELSNGCRVWRGRKSNGGYGVLAVSRLAGENQAYVHCIAWELEHGPVAEGLELDHLCRNRACFNTAHLEPVTPRENVRRSQSFAAKHARKTHCPQGHEYTPENTRLSKRNERSCRVCHRKRQCELQKTPEYKAKRRQKNKYAQCKQREYGVRCEMSFGGQP